MCQRVCMPLLDTPAKAALPPLDTTGTGTLSPLHSPANRTLTPLLETQCRRTSPRWTPQRFSKCRLRNTARIFPIRFFQNISADEVLLYCKLIGAFYFCNFLIDEMITIGYCTWQCTEQIQQRRIVSIGSKQFYTPIQQQNRDSVIEIESPFLFFFIIYGVIIKLRKIEEFTECHVECYGNLMKCMHFWIFTGSA